MDDISKEKQSNSQPTSTWRQAIRKKPQVSRIFHLWRKKHRNLRLFARALPVVREAKTVEILGTLPLCVPAWGTFLSPQWPAIAQNYRLLAFSKRIRLPYRLAAEIYSAEQKAGQNRMRTRSPWVIESTCAYTCLRFR